MVSSSQAMIAAQAAGAKRAVGCGESWYRTSTSSGFGVCGVLANLNRTTKGPMDLPDSKTDRAPFPLNSFHRSVIAVRPAFLINLVRSQIGAGPHDLI